MTNPKKERSLVIIKPDGVQRSLVGEIIYRFERVGLKVVALKMVLANEDQCLKHYNKDDAWFKQKGERSVEERKNANMPVEKPAIEYGKDIVRALVKFMTSGPVVVIILEGNQAVGIVKKIVGGTEPLTSDVGTIRGDLTVDSYDLATLDTRAVRNLIHCSDSPDEAEREIGIWVKENEIINYRHIQSKMLYDVNLDGILE
ncbi:MAG: nucleoside-diphosphate kinase [Candidatus Pacebacteria bacterium]|nr:nucleoside-diphosphate kinase [Candidatus Paceibacterota bacterium]MDD3072184.1 nucleoside-diphosphate kinase [Candidatus Paceibacterota bacterium]MDD3728751.1 nucleoside-diphosphate kinase [Candidatus Paceibacterota bacterium]MDD4201390.1 nucleoside-diphosphate kinase [Candidatus Paceibacterota bacterium]MDD4466830.1 nucleoside-diphosphate kinase [Candidatus Paceibacterota bacterium]